MTLAVVILAAGESRRLGRCKALVPIAGRVALEHLLDAASHLGGAPPPLVVTGADDEPIRAHLERTPHACSPQLVHNAEWAAGRTGSVLCAVRARPGHDLCLAPVDVPLVGAPVFAALAASWSAAGAPPRGWLAPATRRPGSPAVRASVLRFGHPVVVGRALLESLSSEGSDRPLSELRTGAQPLFSVEVADPAILDDLDTPSDLATIRERKQPP